MQKSLLLKFAQPKQPNTFTYSEEQVKVWYERLVSGECFKTIATEEDVSEGVIRRRVKAYATSIGKLDFFFMAVRDSVKARSCERNTKYRSKPVGYTDPRGNKVKFKSIQEAQRATKHLYQDIIDCCKGRIPDVKGYVWEYL